MNNEPNNEHNNSQSEPLRQGQVPPVPQPAVGAVPPTQAILAAQNHNETQSLNGGQNLNGAQNLNGTQNLNETQQLNGLYPQRVHNEPHVAPQNVWNTQAQTSGHGMPAQPDALHANAAYSNAPHPSATHSNASQQNKKSTATPIIATAALTALLASGATVGVTKLLEDNTSTPTGVTSQQSQGENGSAGTVKPIENSTNQNPDWETVTNAVAKTVVAIEVESNRGGSQGSGVIIDTSGHIITNNHVVEGAKNNEVNVTLDDGRIYTAEITGLDPATDLAVIKIKNPPADLSSASLADSSQVTVGSSVLAMGNPLGLSQTATTGIVSALDRPVSTAQTSDGTMVVTNAIQIDAAINPGNSGGPLFNSKGEVIGITSSIATMSGSNSSQAGSIGLGFAIPANLANNISQQLIKNGKAEHAFLGVSMTDGSATVGDETRQGAKVHEVTADSAAAKAGVQKDDVIVSVNGKKVTGSESLTGFVRELRSGDSITLGLIRNGELKEIQATLSAKTEEATTIPEDQQGNSGNGDSGNGDSGGNWWDKLPGLGGNSDKGSGQDGSGSDGSQDGNGGSNVDPSNPNNTPSMEDLQKLFEYFQNGGR